MIYSCAVLWFLMHFNLFLWVGNHIRYEAPFVVSVNQLRTLSDQGVAANLRGRKIIVKLLAESDDGLVVLTMSVDRSIGDSMPVVLTKNGDYKSRQGNIYKHFYTHVDEHKKPVFWVTASQVIKLNELAKVAWPKPKVGDGIKILRRTDQGLVAQFWADAGPRNRVSAPFCITNEGRKEVPNLRLPATHLTWRDQLKLGRL